MNEQNSGFVGDSVSRRRFLATGGASVLGLSLGEVFAAPPQHNGHVVQVLLTGGASHLETFDPKPDAPREIRGPLHSIATQVPGVRFAECLPQLAQRADQLVVLRSLHHDAAPIHETGLQLLLSGSLVRRNQRPPGIGVVAERLLKKPYGGPVSVQLGGPVHQTGVTAYHGDGCGILGDEDEPHNESATTKNEVDFSRAPARVREAYGETRFGRLLWSAARSIESGVRYVLVHSFDQLEGTMTWDAHGNAATAPATIFDYRDSLGPEFDRAMAAFLDDLQQSGMWNNTLVVCTGEMGRSPRINDHAGRDHWTNVWSGILAGGMLEGGQVIGASDPHGERIQDAPIPLGHLSGMIYDYLGIAPGTELTTNRGESWTIPLMTATFS